MVLEVMGDVRQKPIHNELSGETRKLGGGKSGEYLVALFRLAGVKLEAAWRLHAWGNRLPCIVVRHRGAV